MSSINAVGSQVNIQERRLQLQEKLEAWTRAAPIGERREEAKEEILRYLQQPESSLSFANLNLSSLPDIWEDESFEILTHLSFHGNRLSSLPESLKALSRLEFLGLTSNSMATLPAWMSCFACLKILEIGCNPLNVVPEVVRYLPLLKNLYLHETSLAQLPDWIGELKNLHILNLENNQLRVLPERVGELTQLTQLTLSKNQLDNLPSLQALQHLSELYVDKNPLQRLAIPKINALSFQYTPDLEWDPQELLSLPCNSDVHIKVENREDGEALRERLVRLKPDIKDQARYEGPSIVIETYEEFGFIARIRSVPVEEHEEYLNDWAEGRQPEERREEIRDRIKAWIENEASGLDLRDVPIRSLPSLSAYGDNEPLLKLSYRADMDVESFLKISPLYDIEIETANEEEARQLEEALYYASILESPREKYLGPTLNVIFTKTVAGIPHKVRDSFEMSQIDGEWITVKTKATWRASEDLGAQMEILYRPEGEERRPFREICTNLLAMIFEIVPVGLREETTIAEGLAKIYKFLEKPVPSFGPLTEGTSEIQQEHLLSWLNQLQEVGDVKNPSNKKAVYAAIARSLELANSDASFRSIFYDVIATASVTCGDRVALSIIELDLKRQLLTLDIDDKAKAIEFLQRGCFAMELLGQIAEEKIARERVRHLSLWIRSYIQKYVDLYLPEDASVADIQEALRELPLQFKGRDSLDYDLPEDIDSLKEILDVFDRSYPLEDNQNALELFEEENSLDEVEIYLGYPIRLKKDLKLPFSMASMLYFTCSNISQEELAQARAFVTAQMGDDRAFAAYLLVTLTQPANKAIGEKWLQILKSVKQEAMEAIEQAFEAAQEGEEPDYVAIADKKEKDLIELSIQVFQEVREAEAAPALGPKRRRVGARELASLGDRVEEEAPRRATRRGFRS